jgi:hypothetical protein
MLISVGMKFRAKRSSDVVYRPISSTAWVIFNVHYILEGNCTRLLLFQRSFPIYIDYVTKIIFMYSLVKDAFSVIQNIMSNERMVDKWWNVKDVEGSGRDLI